MLDEFIQASDEFIDRPALVGYLTEHLNNEKKRIHMNTRNFSVRLHVKL